MYDAQQFKEILIVPTLKKMAAMGFVGADNPSAVNLLIGTAYHESLGGKYLKQVGGGPALGVFQIEPETHKDIWVNYLCFRQESVNILKMLSTDSHVVETNDWLGMQLGTEYRQQIEARFNEMPWHSQLITNLEYSIVIARLIYYRQSFEWPNSSSMRAIAELWKDLYNTSKGAGTVDQFLDHFPAEILD